MENATLAAMESAAPHRGGGGSRRYVEPGAALAYLGRSDESRSDEPPGLVRHARSGVVVVADARIDNAEELRRRLGAHADLGQEQLAGGAAALIAAAYLCWGPAFVERIIGDFALAVWDPRDRRLLLARDPMSMRALYYRVEPERVLVATEVKQILAVPGVPDEPDERMAAAYLLGCFGDLSWSYYRGIEQVPPAHSMMMEEGEVGRPRRYWDIDPGRRVTYASEAEYAEHLRELLVESVRARMGRSQPIGVLLSGGVDSGAAASAAGVLLEQSGEPARLHSYSWDFGGLTECDERDRSDLIVERFGIAGRDIPVEDAGPLAGYPSHAPDLDDPFHGHFQTMLDRGFARARRDGVGPLFSGMRGDLAAGPIDMSYGMLLRAGRWRELALELRGHPAATGESLVHLALREISRVRPGPWARAASRRLGRMLGGARGRPPTGSLPPWVHPELAERVGLRDLVAEYEDPPTPDFDGPFRRRRYQWLFMPMQHRWAVSHERRVARFGMQAVDPWSDRRIAELCVAMPQQVMDLSFKSDKRLVREAMRGVMPENFRRAARKTVPYPLFEQSLREHATTVRNLLTNSRAEARGWLDTGPLRESFERSMAGARPAGRLWWALSLEWWLRLREAEPTATFDAASSDANTSHSTDETTCQTRVR